MKSTLRMNTRVVPILGAVALLMQIVDPSKVWIILIITMGGAWFLCLWWVRGLARSLTFDREIRYGWAQVGDRLEERFTLTNTFKLPTTSVTVLDHSDLPDLTRPLQQVWMVKAHPSRRFKVNARGAGFIRLAGHRSKQATRLACSR